MGEFRGSGSLTKKRLHMLMILQNTDEKYIITTNITVINFIQNVIEYPSLNVSPYVDEIIGNHQCGF
jgi:hypothetical protein